jgi:hypothetical protein
MNGMGYGCGGYNPYAYGMGYSPYSYSPYGYGYGMGMGYGSYNPMTYYGGYYNSYDHNSSSYSNYGPRGTHAGGNSNMNAPVHPDHMMVKNNNGLEGYSGTSPYTMERFSQVSIPQEHYTKIVQLKNPTIVNESPMYQNSNNGGYGGGRPVYTNGGTYNGDGRPVHNNANGGTPVYNGNVNNGGTVSTPVYNGGGRGKVEYNNNNSGTTDNGGGKPTKWFESSTPVNTTPTRSDWGGGRGFGGGGGNSGGGGGGGSFGGGSSGGGISRPHK